METRQGKIEEKSLAYAKNSAPYATFVISGRKYNTFDQKIIDGFNIDDLVEFTGEMRGQFWTLKTMKKIDAVTQPSTPESNGNDRGYHLSPEEVKCRALECAINWRAAEEIGELTAIADKFVEWIYGN